MESSIRPILRHHTFLSYASPDVEAATRLTHKLQTLQIRVWMDRDPGDHDQAPRLPSDVRGTVMTGGSGAIESTLTSAITFSILVVVLSSSRTLPSVWVRREIAIGCGMKKPFFFWHVVEPQTAQTISCRTSGTPPIDPMPADAFIRAVAMHHKRRFLAPPESLRFMNELTSHEALNVVGHVIGPLSDVDAVCDQLDILIELSELVLHRGELVTTDSLQGHWPQYARLCKEADELVEIIAERYGERIRAAREPLYVWFPLKRPFVLTRIAHLKKILEDEEFRSDEFAKLKG